MDSPSPPPVPDPYATANAQKDANIEAARHSALLSRYNQVTPYGNMTWKQDGDNWTSTITLDPRVQALVDSGMNTSLGLDSTTQSALARVQAMLGQPVDYSSLPAGGNYDSALGGAQARVGNGVTLNTDLDGFNSSASPLIPGQQGVGLGAQKLLGMTGSNMAQGLSAPMPTASDSTRQRVEGALFERLMSRIDPAYAEREAQARSTLMNRGIVENSEAWRNEMDTLLRGYNDATSGAARDAVTMGGQEQSRLLGNELQVRDQYGKEASGTAGLLSSVLSGLSGLSGMRLGEFAGENAALTGQQGLDIEELRLEDALASNQFNMQNSQRANVLNELMQARGFTLNELASLRSGQQVQTPNFQPVNTAANVNASPIAQSIWNAYQGQLGQYQTEVGANNALLAALAQIGGSALMFR